MVFLINQRKSIDEEHPRSFSLIALIQGDDDQNHHHDRHHNHSSQDPDMEFVATVTTGGRGIFFPGVVVFLSENNAKLYVLLD